MLSALSKDANSPSHARLLPIDLEDATECSVLFDQRILCGWGQEKIPSWRESMRKGERAHVLDSPPSGDEKGRRSGSEKRCGDVRSGRACLAGSGRHPSPGIDPDPTLAAPDGSVLTISSLFVLPVFSGCGLGRFAMRECERLAQQEPYGSPNCRCLSLWTLSERYAAGGEEGWHGIGRWERWECLCRSGQLDPGMRA
jgi:GNAT superfamily N-acetyltransferase